MLAVERFRRPAAELGPNWLEITTGRARTDEEEVGGAQAGGGRGVLSTEGAWGGVQPHGTGGLGVWRLEVENCLTVSYSSVS